MLEKLLDNYNDERAMSFCGIATAIMPVVLVSKALDETVTTHRGDDSDIKAKGKSRRAVIQDLASKSNINLKLRKKPKEGGKR